MKQTLLAVSVAAALVAPGIALADSSNVSLYGRLALGVESVQAKGATTLSAGQTAVANLAQIKTTDTDRFTRVTDSLSFIGFKGEEELSDDLSALFQVESYVKPDDACYYTGCNTSTGNTSSTFASANSFVALKSAQLGTIHFGRNNMYYDKHVPNELHLLRSGTNSTALSILGNNGTSQLGVGYMAGIFRAPISGAMGNAQAGAAAATTFYSVGGRVSNQVWYKSPVFNNVTIQVAYAAGENKGTASNVATYLPTVAAAGTLSSYTANSSMAEIAAIYMTGSTFASATYMQEKDPMFKQLGGALTKADGLKFSVGHQFSSGTRLGAVIEQQTNTVNSSIVTLLNTATFSTTGDFSDKNKRTAFTLAASQKMGDLDVIGTFGKVGDITILGKKLDNTSAKYFQVTGLYSLSKNANLYATYAKVTNDSAAGYNFFVEGAVTNSSNEQNPSQTARGTDPTAISLGVNYTF